MGTRTRSHIGALALAVVAGCYDEPDIQLFVHRPPEAAPPLHVLTGNICKPLECSCKEQDLFGGELVLHNTFAFYIDDGIDTVVLRLVSASANYRKCVTIDLAPSMLVRKFDLRESIDRWSCPKTPDDCEIPADCIDPEPQC